MVAGYENMESTRRMGTGSFLIGMAAGILVGGITVLLLAPKSGPETRQMLRGKADDAREMIQSRFNQVKDQVRARVGGLKSDNTVP